ncbi:helix-turn-helix domain-containing protein [Streptomyces sp. SL13]|uniref:Helix-turn-helix domain-containing protein n=1 Tax=Streptantibioticus silvisoli TaxID=2705255 RepID=A0AA90K7S4_9ACTN|nr:helix-turn-helix domain-containing protein [Streptantibioticus silvisoli]MDI5969223.1 helix-turn-helix domain-containing protein [Streptantibioticus silvisoli]
MSSEEPGASTDTGTDAGTGRPHLRLTDPRAMRAVAHPTRLALLEALMLREPLTATEAADLVGESPTNCAFHLRTLAKYGFVEEAEGGTGRRRPWRRAQAGFSLEADGSAPQDSESRLAADALTGVVLETWLERIRRVFARRPGFPERWRRLTGMSETVLFMTPEEAEEFTRDAHELLRRFQERSDNAALRPAGSVPVEVIQFSFPFDAVTRPEG